MKPSLALAALCLLAAGFALAAPTASASIGVCTAYINGVGYECVTVDNQYSPCPIAHTYGGGPIFGRLAQLCI